MKILKDVAIATGKTLWHVACKIGKAIDDYGYEHYYGDFLFSDHQQQNDVNDIYITPPSSPKFVGDMGVFDPDLAFDLNENSEIDSFFAFGPVFNGLINLTIEYGGFDFNDILHIQDDIVYHG
jgi:hypothetical protein